VAEFSIEEAVACFAGGYALTRSFLRPCEMVRYRDSIWMVRDPVDPSSRSKDPRITEIYPLQLPADYVVSALTELPGKVYICAVVPAADAPAQTISAYKACGCRYLRSEGLFWLDVNQVEFRKTDLPVGRITSAVDAEKVNAGAGARQIFKEHLTTEDCVCRLYAAFDNDTPVGWVRSIRTGAETAYVSNLYVIERYRRRGIGGALMSAMLADDRRHGVRFSALASSTAGAMLYPKLGYHKAGTLLLFAPPKKAPAEEMIAPN
jgi:GNAT superfamily N-acetyltransferase